MTDFLLQTLALVVFRPTDWSHGSTFVSIGRKRIWNLDQLPTNRGIMLPPQQTRLSEELRSSSRNLDARLRTWNRDRRFHWKPVALGGTDRISTRQILQHLGSHPSYSLVVLSSDSERGTRGAAPPATQLPELRIGIFPVSSPPFSFSLAASASLGAWDTFFSKVI